MVSLLFLLSPVQENEDGKHMEVGRSDYFVTNFVIFWPKILGKFWKIYAFSSVISSNFATFPEKRNSKFFMQKNWKNKEKGKKNHGWGSSSIKLVDS
jgi:hypothetical protein